MLYANGYFLKLLDFYIQKFLAKIYEPEKTTVTTVQKMPVLLVLPFIGSQSFKLHTELSKLLKNSYPQVNMRCIFVPMMRIANLF